MEIKFAGLIAHVTIDPGLGSERQLAAMVAAADHKATLSVRKQFVKNDGGIGQTIGNTTCFPLTGRVSFPDLGYGKAGRLAVNGDVPSLKKVTTGTSATLSLELTDPTPDPAVFYAVVNLPPGGRLAAADFFKYEVDFNAVPFGGLARMVQYLVSTAGDIKIDIGGTGIELYQDPQDVLIANVCAQTGNHFQNYKLLFDPVASSVYDPDDSAHRPCPWATPQKPLPDCAFGSTLAVDCSNSTFP